MQVNDLIRRSTFLMKENRISSAVLDSEILMAEVLKTSRLNTLLVLNKKVDKKKINIFNELVNQRLRGKPIAYIIKKKEFWKNTFFVDEGVLIPRPDTELLIEQVIELTRKKDNLKILDVGVGSGCILLSILKEKKGFIGVGMDISKKCIQISKINASKLGLNNRVKFFKSDIDNFTYGKYDLIISNPPYISYLNYKNLKKDILGFEPRLALDGGKDGIIKISKVIKKSSELIKKSGKLIIEIAYDQNAKVKKLLINEGFYINKILKDLAGNYRCIISTKI